MMENNGCPPKFELPLRADDMGLAVKDGVREVRFNLRQGARRLLQGAQAAAEDRGSVSGPLALLGEPLERAMRTTARLLRTVDRAAVDLLSSDGAYRALEVPLCSSGSYFDNGVESSALRRFTQDHYWRYRHWLAMKGRTDVFVREQGIERAGHWLGSESAAVERDRFGLLAHAILALAKSDILVPAALPEREGLLATAELAWQAAVCTVLAGEIAVGLPELTPKEQTITALWMADEIVGATRDAWGSDLAVGASATGLARWMRFALRHV
ncbi:hypothetical protein [Variovorax ginsengisoli]|uniref:Uncharacterized protein n=1 Tax=Variovorax ginsengisoli TaxID=363844 RepID=A0ABT9S3B8_9BURK|nr:hypothetical protein [Variovorax ginsengisoli]MDP9898838.1 hypothetical protein [Variovorax ginsengisoli]